MPVGQAINGRLYVACWTAWTPVHHLHTFYIYTGPSNTILSISAEATTPSFCKAGAKKRVSDITQAQSLHTSGSVSPHLRLSPLHPRLSLSTPQAQSLHTPGSVSPHPRLSLSTPQAQSLHTPGSVSPHLRLSPLHLRLSPTHLRLSPPHLNTLSMKR